MILKEELILLTARIFFFSYQWEAEWATHTCIEERVRKLYDVKHMNKSAYLIKTDDDIDILNTYLSTCFEKEETYFLVDITDQSNRHQGLDALNINRWMDNI